MAETFEKQSVSSEVARRMIAAAEEKAAATRSPLTGASWGASA